MNIKTEQMKILTVLSIPELISVMPNEKFNTKTKKIDVIVALRVMLDKDPLLYRRLLRKFPETLAMRPSEVEAYLRITKTERKRWTEDGKLKVSHHESFHKWGKTYTYPLYDRLIIESLVQEKITEWREKQKEIVQKNKEKGKKKASATKSANDRKRKTFYQNEYKKMLLAWNIESPERAATYELAHWLHWLNKWAKHYHQKSVTAIKKKEEYQQKKLEYYHLKNDIIRLLAKSPYVQLSVYVPDIDEERVLKKWMMCEEHYHYWCKLRESLFRYYPKDEFFLDSYHKKIKNCPTCMDNLKENQQFFTLIYLEVLNNKKKTLFSFHTPLPIAKAENTFDVPLEELNKVVHIEQEGLFRFGRPVNDDEKIIFTERKMLSELEHAKQKFLMYFSHEDKEKITQ